MVEIEKIYQTESEQKEFEEAYSEAQNLKSALDNLWGFDFAKLMAISDVNRIKNLEAWNQLMGLLEDLTDEERRSFDEATKRTQFFFRGN